MIWFSRSNNNLSVHQVMPAPFVGFTEAIYLAWAALFGGVGALGAGLVALVRDALSVDGARSENRMAAIRRSSIPWWAFGIALFLIGCAGGLAMFSILWATGIMHDITDPIKTLSACVAGGVLFGSYAVGGTIFRDIRLAKTAFEEAGIQAPRREDDNP